MLLFCVAAASGAPLGEAVGPLSYTHELSVGRSPPYRATVNELTQTLSTTAANRTIELVQWADKCARIVPPNLDVQRDCFNLAIAGSGSRTIYDMAKNDGWKRAVHAHSETVITQLAESSPPPRCFVVELREPAARIEAWFKECDWVQKSGTLDEFFEKSMLGDNPHTSERTFPVITYFRNYSGVELPFNGGSVAPADIHKKESLLWGAVQWYKEHGDETQVPGIDVSDVYIDEQIGAPATVDAPLIDCEEKQIVIGFLCAETLVPSFEAFASSAKVGTPITPPTGLQVGVNPVLNLTHYPEPTSKFMLSEQNRRIWNDAFMFDDMALYRHFCLGEVDDALVQQNDAAGGGGAGWMAHGTGKPSL